MAKRFIDTELLTNPSIRELPTLYKLVWVALITRCDHAGIWVKDFELLSLVCGGKVEEKIALKHFGEDVVPVDGGRRWFIPKFIRYQYPKGLSESAPAQGSVIAILGKFGLYSNGSITVPIQLGNSTSTLYKEYKDKDMDKDQDTDEDKDKEKSSAREVIFPWTTETFLAKWQLWKDSRKERGLRAYKPIGEQSALKRLAEVSGGAEDSALRSIDLAMANSWQGFWPEGKNGKPKKTFEEKIKEIWES